MAQALPRCGRRCRCLRFLQLYRAVIATHFDGLAADLHLDCTGVERAIARRAGSFRHGFRLRCLPDYRARRSKPAQRPAPLSEYLATQRRLAEFGRRAAVSALEGGAEVAMTRKTEI